MKMPSLHKLFSGRNGRVLFGTPKPPPLPPPVPIDSPSASFEVSKDGPLTQRGADRLAAFPHPDQDLQLLRDSRPRVVFRNKREALADTVYVLDKPMLCTVQDGRVTFGVYVRERIVVDITCDPMSVTMDSSQEEEVEVVECLEEETLRLDEDNIPALLPLDSEEGENSRDGQ